MSDAKHHSNGVCLSCGGTVDEAGMAQGGEVEADEHEAAPAAPAEAPAKDTADDNDRAFALALEAH